MHLQMANVTLASTPTHAMPVTPSYRLPNSPYNQPARLWIDQLMFRVQPTGSYRSPPGEGYRGGAPVADTTVDAPPSGPTPFTLSKRQVQIHEPNLNPVAVTVTVPPPTSTATNGQWPVINPGSAGACWSDMACNSVCPNFQQNGWYAHCIDQACTQCRCQIISPNMCSGQAWSNATWVSSAPSKTVQINPAVATATVVLVAQAGPSIFDQLPRRTRWKFLSISCLLLTSWLAS